MADIAQAATCINYHQNVPANIRRTQVFLQYSANHKELKPDQVQYFVSSPKNSYSQLCMHPPFVVTMHAPN